MCNFTYRHLAEIIDKGREYDCAFITFSEIDSVSPPGAILLRHDIDHSLDAAKKMAEFEKTHGIRATYFILLHGDYNLLSEEGLAHLRAIQGSGHEIGLHYDVRIYDACGWSLGQGIEKDLTLLQTFLDRPVSSLSIHNPTTSREIKEENLRGLRDVYALGKKWGYRYLSDSCQSWREGCVCQKIVSNAKLHILIHPIWWHDEEVDLFNILEVEKDKSQDKVNRIYKVNVEHYRRCLSERDKLDQAYRYRNTLCL